MYCVKPIGVVHDSSDDPELKTIEIMDEYAAGLGGLEGVNACWVLYWMHELSSEARSILKVHPRGDYTRPERGVFATHSPVRPNPIGMTRVELVSVAGTTLGVRGLDARSGSPVIDIKSAD